MEPMLSPIARILAERTRQQNVEGYAAAHDDEHKNGELADAAACYATSNAPEGYLDTRNDVVSLVWPWDEQPKFSANTIDGRLRELEKAGALIVAEMERLERRKEAVDEEHRRARMRWEGEAQAARAAGQPVPDEPVFDAKHWRA